MLQGPIFEGVCSFSAHESGCDSLLPALVDAADSSASVRTILSAFLRGFRGFHLTLASRNVLWAHAFGSLVPGHYWNSDWSLEDAAPGLPVPALTASVCAGSSSGARASSSASPSHSGIGATNWLRSAFSGFRVLVLGCDPTVLTEVHTFMSVGWFGSVQVLELLYAGGDQPVDAPLHW